MPEKKAIEKWIALAIFLNACLKQEVVSVVDKGIFREHKRTLIH